MVVVQQHLAQTFVRWGQPAVLQSDRAPCFVGAEGGRRQALPSRLTLWLWGLGIEHRLIPVKRPQRNGAVERFQGAMESSWRDEPDGLVALMAVWSVDKPERTPIAYRDRAGFQLVQVWTNLERVRVRRRVDGQGKLSLWDHPVRVGSQLAGQEVVVSFAAEQQVAVVCDLHERGCREVRLPWLTVDWLWACVPATPRPPDSTDSATF